ncbi:HAD family hydrolase [Actinocorallia populi]|uniref:HAD family hydrolase n=1 Tax=Actinocorallia populi TaxID=2079200 RepID=UPI0038BA56EA
MPRMSRLHVFDLDGTLLRDTTAGLEIARRLGCLADLELLEEDFARGLLDTRGFAAGLCRLWHDLQEAVVTEAFAAAPWIGGMAEVFSDIARRGEHAIVITMSPDFFARGLLAHGLREVVASRFPSLPLREAADPSGILTPADKVTAVDRVLASLSLSRHDCVAYGDSGSDIPLFQALPHTVAVNATPSLRALTTEHYDGDDLRVPYERARRRLDARR